MAEIQVRLFCEDEAHENTISALIRKIADELAVPIRIWTSSARGGHGRVRTELRSFQRHFLRLGDRTDLLVVAIDANCQGFQEARTSIRDLIDTRLFPSFVLAIPDPHIERWLLAEPEALFAATGAHAPVERRKCDRDRYKEILVRALEKAGQIVLLGGAEFAMEIVDQMDLFRAGRNEVSLKHFIDDIRAALRRFRS
jgi:hypothetical protein